uniref:Uncharacterized protein n=1 Tax=Proboscia inermis TaxID=420281 RepID=A0A7S0CIY2_9STRA
MSGIGRSFEAASADTVSEAEAATSDVAATASFICCFDGPDVTPPMVTLIGLPLLAPYDPVLFELFLLTASSLLLAVCFFSPSFVGSLSAAATAAAANCVLREVEGSNIKTPLPLIPPEMKRCDARAEETTSNVRAVT